MNEEIFTQEEDFQPYLLENHYTFVGPVNDDLFEKFIKIVNEIAPPNVFHTIHNVLSNSKTTRKALDLFPPDTQLRIYVVSYRSNSLLIHSTINGYCEKFNVDYSEN